MRDFSSLTTRGRAGRLRRLALGALPSWDVEVARLRLLTNWTNCIFRVDTACGGRLVLRICEPACCHGAEEIAAETAWLAALARDTDIVVPAPLPSRSGRLYVEAGAEGIPGRRYCMLQSWVPGRDLARCLSPEHYSKLGEVAARLHVHAASFILPEGIRIRSMDRVFPWSAPGFEHFERIVIFDPEHSHLFPGDGLCRFYAVIDRAQEEIDRLYGTHAPPRVIHQDLHPWNVKVDRGRISVLDFEDLILGHPVQDVATALFYVRFRTDDGPALIESFRNGYERILPWPEEYPGQIDLLIAARALLLVNFLLSVDTPEYRRDAPGYVELTGKRLGELVPGV